MSIQQGVSRRNVLLGGGAGVLGAMSGLAPLVAADAAAAQARLGVKMPVLWRAAACRGIL